MNTYYQQPATADDLRFVLRCLWALDPNRHLFEGDFRDFVREKITGMTSLYGGSRDIPESALDELEQSWESWICSRSTHQCWKGIVRGMRQNLHKIHVMKLWDRTYGLWRFVRHRFGYDSGRYWAAEAFPAELSGARDLAYNDNIELLASKFRRALNPDSLECALILWMLWCLDILWPEQARRSDPDYRTPYSRTRKFLEEIEGHGAVPPPKIPTPIADVDPTLVDRFLHRRLLWCSLAHALARSGRVELFGLLDSMPIDERNHDGEPPLLVAIYWRKWKAARWFLNAGANPARKSIFGEPALAVCLGLGAPMSLVFLFLKKGANPSQTDSMGNTALHAAAAAGLPAAIRAMSDVPVESRNKLGHTPLYSAVFAMVAGKGSRLAAIKALLAAGAEPDPTSKRGVRVSDFLARALELGANPRTIRQIRSILR